MERVIYTVSQITAYLKQLLEGNELLSQIWIAGELSNFKNHASGHMYFTLKDAKARLRCVMFRGFNAHLQFVPEDGMMVLVLGAVSIYEKNGDYQLYVQHMEPLGLGNLYLALEQLKKKLAAEGIFDEARKKKLPFLPKKIALITSVDGAALRDMIKVLRQRNPGLHIIIVPALVQGEEAPESLVEALKKASRIEELDVVIIGRGGGSLEELWAFNDERVVRAISQCPVPLISAVGHETDYTLADLAADMRAPTPSIAAALATPEIEKLVQKISDVKDRIKTAVQKLFVQKSIRLKHVVENQVFRYPEKLFWQQRQSLDEMQNAMFNSFRHFLQCRQKKLSLLTGSLSALSPLATLARGYAICQKLDKEIVKDAAQLKIDEFVELQFMKGRAGCRVEKVIEHTEVDNHGC